MISEFGLTHADAAERLGLAQSTLSNKLRVLRLDKTERERITAARLSERHALQLSYYAAACTRMYGAPPREVLIYSLPLGDAIPVEGIEAM